ncbi:uncharacterized protein EV420DRAFT_1003068 [Desarmillaria tabescens]|uniref:DUF6533 domain-containing protein n=1 Tax=Armillaria tabescens TaxID=1929756 RepID=A0AA39JMS4_ARMTA|nr:uncharacterized protein EV420DRAFT_1003068 [Desarmillaria tabescens]KAK0444566.1 hypothetical protein EV420DRAFT_1003068 [Desarmillaria tabescens]
MSLNGLTAAGLRDLHSTRYSALASGVIVLFDHLITLDDEVDLVWRSHWSIGKLLFIINRYYTLLSVIFNYYGLFMMPLSESVSHRFFQWQGWTGLIACMIAEVILQMRLYALYLLNKKVLALMVTSFIICSASAAVIMGIVLSKLSMSYTLAGTSFCAPNGIPDYFYTFWIPTIAFESLLCGLALFRGFQTFSSDGPLFSSGRHLVSILIRDSVFYFVVMFATYLTNLLVWTAAPADLLEIPIGFSVTFSCVMSNRIILNVRRANQEVTESKATGSPEQRSKKDMDLLGDQAYVSHATVTDIEMMQLRSMRSEHRQPTVII